MANFVHKDIEYCFQDIELGSEDYVLDQLSDAIETFTQKQFNKAMEALGVDPEDHDDFRDYLEINDFTAEETLSDRTLDFYMWNNDDRDNIEWADKKIGNSEVIGCDIAEFCKDFGIYVEECLRNYYRGNATSQTAIDIITEYERSLPSWIWSYADPMEVLADEYGYTIVGDSLFFTGQ